MAAVTRAAAALECDGDGQSGPRIQVLYVHAANVPSRYNQYLASFRAWTLAADTIMQESAAETGGSRRFRFVTPGCQLEVENVTLSAAGDNNFDATIDELDALGYGRTDRKYLIFVDTTTAGICGIATSSGDDIPSQANWSNYGPDWARVDAGCWSSPKVIAHELMHTLGAVNDSAPNSSRGGHCIDDYDVMCYSDEPYRPQMRYDCPNPADENRLDCGDDDYFHPNPPPDSYLATHWNTADNRFLVGGGNGPDDDGQPPIVTWIAPVGNGATHEASAGEIELRVNATDASGINLVDFQWYDRVEEHWVDLATDDDAPYSATLDVTDLNPGRNTISAAVYDGAATWASAQIVVERTEPNAQPPAVSWRAPVADGQTFPASRGTIHLEADASDASGIAMVRFYRYDAVANDSVAIGIDREAPYTAELAVSDLRSGLNQINAHAHDIYDNDTYTTIWIKRVAPAPAIAIAAPRNGAKIKARSTVTIAATITDPVGAATVEFRRCAGSSCSWNGASPIGSDDSAPYSVRWIAPASGTVTFLAQVTDDDGADLSGPVKVKIQKAKTKKKRR